ncbi:MAG: hypothetical protein AVO33_09180 [delta proteobacterium ML8_F1]|nr:MAG: hypothetical protein AVO33_09180 [delta proteobacterium ML8_F1]
MKRTLTVDGMTCVDCEEKLFNALKSKGLSDIEIRLDEGLVFIDNNSDLTDSDIVNTVYEVGYVVKSLD